MEDELPNEVNHHTHGEGKPDFKVLAHAAMLSQSKGPTPENWNRFRERPKPILRLPQLPIE
jgi:hypothetical protein